MIVFDFSVGAMAENARTPALWGRRDTVRLADLWLAADVIASYLDFVLQRRNEVGEHD
jgi:hypothetical protein